MAMINFSMEEAETWERFYRANVLSSLSGCKPAMLVGTINDAGICNLALFQNIVHLGANPALIGLINRPETATPHTLQNIRNQGYFSLNAVTKTLIAKAHQTSAKYAEDIDEFEATGLAKNFIDGCDIPFVEKSPVQVLLALKEIIPITHNQTFLIIGEVKSFRIQDGLVAEDGFVNLTKAGVVCTIGLDAYASPTMENRFAYAKPDTEPQGISI